MKLNKKISTILLCLAFSLSYANAFDWHKLVPSKKQKTEPYIETETVEIDSVVEETPSDDIDTKKQNKVSKIKLWKEKRANAKSLKKAQKAQKQKKQNVKKAIKKQAEEPIQSDYTNDIHSIFSLEKCIEVAIAHNPSIRATIYDEDVYKSRIGQAWANYFPSISAGIQIDRSGSKYTKEKYTNLGSNYNTMGYIPSVSADMLLFDFGKTKASADMAKRLWEASMEDTKEYINNIIYDIKSAYFNILFAQAQVRVYNDTVKDYELQLSQAQSFYKLGKKAKIDVVTAEYNLGKAKLNLVTADNVLKVARAELSKIMGIPEYTNYELSDQMLLNKYDVPMDEVIKLALEVRPEYISAQKNLEAAKMNLRAARRDFTPNIGAFASYSNGYSNRYDVTSSQFGVGLSYSGTNFAKIKKQIDEAKATYKKTKAQLDDTRDSVYFSVKKNYLNTQTSAEAIVIAKLALDQAKEQYRQVTGRYKAGVGDAIELKDGENTYLNARLDFYNAMLNYNTAVASLECEVGVPLILSEELILNVKQEDL